MQIKINIKNSDELEQLIKNVAKKADELQGAIQQLNDFKIELSTSYDKEI